MQIGYPVVVVIVVAPVAVAAGVVNIITVVVDADAGNIGLLAAASQLKS